MSITSISVCKIEEPHVLAIGRQMENHYRQIVFDCSGYDVDVTSVTLVHQRSQDIAPYIVATSNENTLTWNISNTDTTYSGFGQAELRISFANGLAKSAIFKTVVLRSITGDTTIPEPLESWYDAMIDYIDENSISPEELGQAIESYIAEHPIEAPVTSVNGKIGAVVLGASDVGALPDTTVIPARTSQLQNDSGYISSYTETDPVFTASPAHGITAQDISAWNAKSDFSGDYDDLTNKPTIPSKTSQLQNDSGFVTSVPVSSVNNKTGDVVLNASDVHALPDSTVIPTVPTNVSAFQNDAGYLTAIPSEYVTETELQIALAPKANTADLATVATSGDYDDLNNKPTIPTVPSNVSAFTNDANYITASQAPVQSVNGQTGAVTVSVPTKTSDLTNDSGFITSAPVSSVDGKTGAVTVLPAGGDTGQVLAKASATDRDVEWTTPQGGGGSDWTVYYENTTTADALLQIPVTNIDCTEVEVQIVMPTWSSNVNVYAPLMQTNGSHWNVNGYIRMIKEIPSNTSQKRYCVMRFEGVTIAGHAYFCSWCATNTGTSNLQYKYDESANMTAGMHITALSVATIANVPAGTMVLVRGR